MDKTYLLKTDRARRLYESVAPLPIIDFHNHISPFELAENKRYESIHELWVEKDPYKHRLMRILGIPERLITGDASPREKFRAFCGTLPYMVGAHSPTW